MNKKEYIRKNDNGDASLDNEKVLSQLQGMINKAVKENIEQIKASSTSKSTEGVLPPSSILTEHENREILSAIKEIAKPMYGAIQELGNRITRAEKGEYDEKIFMLEQELEALKSRTENSKTLKSEVGDLKEAITEIFQPLSSSIKEVGSRVEDLEKNRGISKQLEEKLDSDVGFNLKDQLFMDMPSKKQA